MTDNDFLLEHLRDGLWHSHTQILAESIRTRGCGLTIHSRASDLRKRGHRVETRLDRDDGGRARSHYRLVTLNEPSNPPGELDADHGPVSLAEGSLSVPTAVPPLTEPSGSTVTSPPVEPSAGTLQRFACDVDESAGLRGAYGNEAA